MPRNKPANIARNARASRPAPPRGDVLPVNTMDKAVLRALSMTDGGGRTQGPFPPEVVRFRPKGGMDRRIVVEYLPDPENSGSVLLRLTPSTAAMLTAPEPQPELLGTQEAADILHVSRPYVTKLVDSGMFSGVVRTASGHRRIPRAEVERVHAEMRAARRSALDEIEKITHDLRVKELEAARANPRRRWVRKQP